MNDFIVSLLLSSLIALGGIKIYIVLEKVQIKNYKKAKSNWSKYE